MDASEESAGIHPPLLHLQAVHTPGVLTLQECGRVTALAMKVLGISPAHGCTLADPQSINQSDAPI